MYFKKCLLSGTLPYSSLRAFLFFESEVMYQPSSIELYSMIIINSPIKLETEKGARESLKQECAASGQLIHRVN